MLSACGLHVPGTDIHLNFCPAPAFEAGPAIDPDHMREVALRQELATLERQAARLPRCPAPVAPSPPASPVPEAPPSSVPAEVPAPASPHPQACLPRTDTVVVLLDVSGSMEYSYGADPQDEDNLAALMVKAEKNPLLALLSNLSGEQRLLTDRLRNAPGPQRLALAKDSLLALIDAADPTVSFDFVTFSPCGDPTRLGLFAPADRPALAAAITGAQIQSATGLALAIAAMAGQVPEGTDKPVNIVLVSDGLDSCGGDPCAAARALKSQRPNAVVSVLAMSRSITALRCVADATGGKFFQPDNASMVAEQLKIASGQASTGVCP